MSDFPVWQLKDCCKHGVRLGVPCEWCDAEEDVAVLDYVEPDDSPNAEDLKPIRWRKLPYSLPY